MIRPLLTAASLAPLLAACAATEGDYPSLARRPVERISGSAQPVPAPPTPPPLPEAADADLRTRLARLVDTAEAAHRTFVEKRARAERLVGAAGGAAVASENWSVANVALGELESARSSAMVALADIDQLYAAERIADAGAVSANALAMAQARDRVIALVDQENEILFALRRRLGV